MKIPKEHECVEKICKARSAMRAGDHAEKGSQRRELGRKFMTGTGKETYLLTPQNINYNFHHKVTNGV